MAKAFFIESDRIGRGDDGLGAVLMHNFLYSLARAEERPAAILFANGGVRLTCEGSGSLDDLGILVDAGVVVASCGTCLDFLGLKESLKVGGVGRMDDLVARMLSEDEVVTVA